MISLTISKRMLKFIGIYKWLYIISLFGGGICAGLRGGIFSIIYKNTFDSSINNIVVTKIILLIIGLLAIALLQRYFNFLFKYCNRHITSTLRIRVFEKLLSTRVCELEINNSGSIQSCLNNDIPALENIYSSKMSSLINTTLIGIVSICVIFILDYRLASVSIIFNVICCLINVKFIPELRRNNRINLESSSKLLQIISSVIYGNKEIKIFSIANHLYDAFNKLNIDNGKTIVDNSKISGIIDGIQLFVRNLTSVGILIIGLFLLFQNKITVGVIVAIMLQQDGISFMFSNFNNYINDLQKSLIGAERVFKLLDMEEEQYEINVYSKERGEFEYSVEFKNVDFRYEDKKVLRDVNLKVKKNNIVAIVGKSGSGKSTLLKLLMSFYRVEKGEIFIEGKDIKEYTLKDLRNKIAYVPQDSYLFNSTINENISYGSSDMEISQEDIINAAKMAGAHEFIMSLPDGYETKVGENSSNFSGGEKQRIAIARAFLKNAPILLLDEPTSALDKATEDIIKQSLLNLMEKRTVLIITHKMTTIDNIDYIYTISQSGFVDLNSGITKS